MGLLMRRPDWPEALAAAVAAAERRPYALGEWDCLAFAFGCIAAMTGQDWWPQFAGRYRTVAGAKRVIRLYGRTLAEAFAGFTGLEVVPILRARRGDVAIYRDAAGEHLGVVMGAAVLVLADDGLRRVPVGSKGVRCTFAVG